MRPFDEAEARSDAKPTLTSALVLAIARFQRFQVRWARSAWTLAWTPAWTWLNASRFRFYATVSCALLVTGLCLFTVAEAARRPKPSLHAFRGPEFPQTFHPSWPLEISGTQYAPLNWSDIAGWTDDDHLAAFRTFRASCAAIVAQNKPPSDIKALGTSLREPCHAARASHLSTGVAAREFFEEHFLPLRISKLGDNEGFVTGYYEPVVDGSRVRTDTYTVPVYRRPSNLFVRGVKQGATDMPNKGQVFRKIGRRKLVPYYDRGQIEDGAIAGRGLEICWLKDQTDLLFMQIQGSARIRFEDGTMMRINYDAHNGYPYTPVGRVLIERNIIPKDQMSMQRIHQWMDEKSRRRERVAASEPVVRLLQGGATERKG